MFWWLQLIHKPCAVQGCWVIFFSILLECWNFEFLSGYFGRILRGSRAAKAEHCKRVRRRAEFDLAAGRRAAYGWRWPITRPSRPAKTRQAPASAWLTYLDLPDSQCPGRLACNARRAKLRASRGSHPTLLELHPVLGPRGMQLPPRGVHRLYNTHRQTYNKTRHSKP